MSMQPVPDAVGQGRTSTTLKVNFVAALEGASFSSMSVSRIWPVRRLAVVVVVAMTPSP